MNTIRSIAATLLALACCVTSSAAAEPADYIIQNADIVTVDSKFSRAKTMAIRNGKIVAVGDASDVKPFFGKETKLIDMQGKQILPGLIDSHVHPSGASMFEFDHPVPEMETIADVLNYVRGRVKSAKEGEWIWVSQVFITRLKEQRYPTRAELDKAAPKNPVVFRTGPDASLNSLALKLSGIDRDFKVAGAGRIEKDPKTGEPNGILRGCTRYIKSGTKNSRKATESDRRSRMIELFSDYNSVGITGVIDRSCSTSVMQRLLEMHKEEKLTVRFAGSVHVGTGGSTESITDKIAEIGKHPLCRPDPILRIIGIKTFLDGGMLTGSAYMRKPWGVSRIYGIDDASYRGVRFIDEEKLVAIVRAATEAKLQFTAHSVGDGAVHALLDAYETVNLETPIKERRHCLTHSNFMSLNAVKKMVALNVVADIQPAWLYLDTRTLSNQFGYDRLRYFQPLKTIFEHKVIAGGGSDHMQKIGSLRSINPYNPFLGMWVTITRQARWYDGRLHPEEALTREQAIRFYTVNNAHLMFLEDEVGSLEIGKRADFIVLDRDLLSCDVDDIRSAKVEQTFLNGECVFKQSN